MAMVGLTARDIQRLGVHPVFFEGSDYAGTLEQHWVSLWFRLLGDSVIVHRLAIAFLLIAVVALVWALTRLAFGARAALWAGAYLALGPPFFFYRGLTSEGPYTPIYLIGAAILYIILAAERRARADSPIVWHVIGVGALGGLGWWTHPLALVWGGCAVAALAAGHLGRKLTPRIVAAGIAASFAGSLPWWVKNVHSGWRSILGPESASATLDAAVTQASRLFRTGIPVLLGTRAMWAEAPLYPAGTALAWAVLVLVAAYGVWLALRPDDSMERFGARLLVPILILCPAFALLSQRTNFVEPRLVFPFYFVIAPLLGSAFARRSLSRAFKVSSSITLLAIHSLAHAMAPRFEPPPSTLLESLRSRGVKAFYASYWDAYTIDFLADGSVVGTPFGRGSLTRRPREAAFVDAHEDAAFLLGGEEARELESLLRRAGVGYRLEPLERRFLFRDLPPEILGPLRRCLCIPNVLPGSGS
jgi:hypothetical protein